MSGKKTHEEEPEHKSETAGMMRWLVSYADMITLLLAVFVVLVGSMETSKAKYTIIAAQAARIFGGGQKSVISGGERSFLEGGQGLAPFPRPKKSEGEGKQKEPGMVSVRITNIGTLITGSSDMLFDSGSSELKADAKQKIEGQPNLESFAKSNDGCLVVKGHTDDRPIATAIFPSNWELSTARAAAVARFLIAQFGVQPARITTSGSADTEPVAENDSDENRQMNRRVEIWLLRSEYCDLNRKMREESKKDAQEFQGL